MRELKLDNNTLPFITKSSNKPLNFIEQAIDLKLKYFELAKRKLPPVKVAEIEKIINNFNEIKSLILSTTNFEFITTNQDNIEKALEEAVKLGNYKDITEYLQSKKTLMARRMEELEKRRAEKTVINNYRKEIAKIEYLLAGGMDDLRKKSLLKRVTHSKEDLSVAKKKKQQKKIKTSTNQKKELVEELSPLLKELGIE